MIGICTTPLDSKLGMNIIFAAGRELAYPRNSQIIHALAQQYQVHLVVSAASRLTTRLVQIGRQLVQQRFSADDVCFIGFYGQPLVFPARLRWRGPLLLDAFVSTYDTLCFDRQIIKPNSVFGRMAFYLDRLSCQMADVVLMDTWAQAEYFERTFDVPRSKLHVVYVGCDDDLFRPLSVPPPDIPTVLFYGTFLPLHGVDIIIQAAHQMAGERVHFQIIGQGQEYERVRNLASGLMIPNIQFLAPVPLEDLPKIIAHATICLGGHFGRSDKAKRVIAGKTFQCLAAGKPTIVGDNPANREIFAHGENVWMCPMADPTALANAIRHLLDSPQLCARLGERGRETVQRTSGNAMAAQSVHMAVETAVALHQSGLPNTDS
jgi:glycosyltransferase involved in cell wall biosynthesis